MNIFLFFLGICGQKDNHMHETLQCISVCFVWQLSQTLLPTYPQKCLSENEKQSLICFVRLPSIFFKLEYPKTEAMVTSLNTEFFLFGYEIRISCRFCASMLISDERLLVAFLQHYFQGLWLPSVKSRSSFILRSWCWTRDKVSPFDLFITAFLYSKSGMFAFIPYFRNWFQEKRRSSDVLFLLLDIDSLSKRLKPAPKWKSSHCHSGYRWILLD